MGSNQPPGTVRAGATRPAVDATLAWSFLGVRAFVLVQAAVALSAGSLGNSYNPALDVTLVGAVAAESVLLGFWLARRRSIVPFRWPVGADMAVALAVLVSTPAYVAPAGRIDTWTMWAYPVTLSTALLCGAAFRRLAQVLAVSGAMALSYLAVTAVPVFSDVVWRATAVVNAMAFPGFAAVAFLLCRFVRDLASAADAAGERVAELEQDRSRALVHDMLGYLRLDRFAEADDQARTLMIAQARAKHEQLRSWVDGTSGAVGLRERIEAVLRLHPGLTVDVAVDAGPQAGAAGVRETELPGHVLEQLERALDTALANVEQHAPGARAVLSVRSAADHLTVSVRDDGPGFDPAGTRPGFGVGEILGRQLAEVGGTGVVESRPGAGTVVSITVPWQRP